MNTIVIVSVLSTPSVPGLAVSVVLIIALNLRGLNVISISYSSPSIESLIMTSALFCVDALSTSVCHVRQIIR